MHPAREAASNPKYFNGTWSPWQVLESHDLVLNALQKIPKPRNKCYYGLRDVITTKKSSKKSAIPEDENETPSRTFLDDLLDEFRGSKVANAMVGDIEEQS